MTTAESARVATVRAYLAALEAGESGETMARFFTPEAIQVEFPNRLNPKGGHSDLATMLKRSQQGTKLLSRQTYETRSAVAQDERVAVEALWTGVLAVAFDTLQPGDSLTAHFAMFFDFADGRIALQRNYDCFEQWS
jgi:ketosteroid isomerase-like protein